jgi:N6-adenosine-specific RNA methylase IME4
MVGKPRESRKKALTPTQIKRRYRARKKVAVKAMRRGDRLQEMRDNTTHAMAVLPQLRQLFNVLLIDPPPRFENWSNISGMDRDAANHYQTMAREELMAMVPEIAKLAAPDCRMYLWVTAPMVPDAIPFIDACGFTFSTEWVWGKTTLDGGKLKQGTGHELRNVHESLYECEKLYIADNSDVVPSPIPGTQPMSLILAPRDAHSRKPFVFHARIEKLFPDMPRLEMFARPPFRRGWHVWGNEVPGGYMTPEQTEAMALCADDVVALVAEAAD